MLQNVKWKVSLHPLNIQDITLLCNFVIVQDEFALRKLFLIVTRDSERASKY